MTNNETVNGSPRMCWGLRALLLVNIIAIVGFGLAFRVMQLGSVPGLNADEYFTIAAVESLLLGTGSQALVTPTGRSVSMPYAASVYFFDLILPRTAWSVRIPAAFSGFLMAFVACFLLRRWCSNFTAAIVTVISVVLPIHISYSRIGWDYSQVPLATLLVVACSLQGRIWLSIVALAAGTLVHLSIAYLLPIVTLSIVFKLYTRLGPKNLKSVTLLLVFPVFGVAIFSLVLLGLNKGLEAHVQSMLTAVPGNFFDMAKICSFVKLYANIFGVEVALQNLRNSPGIVFNWYNTAFLALDVVLHAAYFILLWRRYREGTQLGRELPVVLGLLASIGGFYLTCGPGAITPPYERYALFLVMPSLIVLAVITENIVVRPRLRGAALAGVCVVGWVMLFEFKEAYFDFFERTGGTDAMHPTYRTNQIDPKISAYQWVNARESTPVLYLKEWRSYWPVKYVASTSPEIRVVSLTPSLWTGGYSAQEFSHFLALNGNEFAATLKAHKGYIIGFYDLNFDAQLRAFMGTEVTRKDFTDGSGLAVVSTWYLAGPLG